MLAEIEIFEDVPINGYTKILYKISTFGRVINKITGRNWQHIHVLDIRRFAWQCHRGYANIFEYIDWLPSHFFPIH